MQTLIENNYFTSSQQFHIRYEDYHFLLFQRNRVGRSGKTKYQFRQALDELLAGGSYVTSSVCPSVRPVTKVPKLPIIRFFDFYFHQVTQLQMIWSAKPDFRRVLAQIWTLCIQFGTNQRPCCGEKYDFTHCDSWQKNLTASGGLYAERIFPTQNWTSLS